MHHQPLNVDERMVFAVKSSLKKSVPWLIPTLFVMCTQVFLTGYPRNTHLEFSVIGLSDGLTVPFALAAGLSSLGESNLVVLGGIAELIAGAISMGIGGFLASQAERDHYRYLRDHTAHRVLKSCAGEMEREISAVLAPVGVDDQTCRAVARCLREVEEDSRGNSGLRNGGGTDSENVGLKWSQDVGITAFLLKFGQGLGA
jgi:vacuolar iron transporter family protein